MTALIELYANNAYSTLANSILSTDTTINVTSGSSFPNPSVGTQFFRLTITSHTTPNSIVEIVYVTARSGGALTVIRGQEGTTAQAWSVNDLCANEPTKGMLNQFMQPYTGVDTGTLNAYVVNTPQHETAYYTGMPCTFYTLNSNTISAPTLNLNGLGASPIRNYSGGILVSGQVQANAPISLLYNLANNSWYMQTAIAMPNGFTPSRAIVSNVGGVLANSSTTSDEIGFVSGVTSPIQTQINNRVLYTDFTESFGVYNSVYSSYNNGYQVLPSGLIIAWMEFKTFSSAAGRTSVSLTFLNGVNSFAFPNAALSWQAVSANGNGIGSPTSVGIGPACTTTTVDLLWDANTVGAFITVMGH